MDAQGTTSNRLDNGIKGRTSTVQGQEVSGQHTGSQPEEKTDGDEDHVISISQGFLLTGQIHVGDFFGNCHHIV